MLVEAAIGGIAVIGILVFIAVWILLGPEDEEAGFGELVLLGLSIAYIMHFFRKHRND